jgi:hypothetical protein
MKIHYLNSSGAIKLNDDSDSVGATLRRFVTEKYKNYIKVGTIFCVEKVAVSRLHPNKNSFNTGIFIDEDTGVSLRTYELTDA